MKKRKVLIISYRYPPMQTMGALRASNIAKRLPLYGWEPVVVTVTPGTDFYMRGGQLEVPPMVEVHRTKDRSFHQFVIRLLRAIEHQGSNEGELKDVSIPNKICLSTLKRWAHVVYRQIICFPDECIPWYLLEYRAIRAIAKRTHPKVILSSSLPNTCHLIAHRLTRELNIPWVADFRDLWTQNHISKRIWPLRWIEKELEKKVIRKASALVTVSEPLAEQLKTLHRKQTFIIPNGFDEMALSLDHQVPTDVLTITYTGMIYPGKRDPAPLFRALVELLREGFLSLDEIRVRFYGRKLSYIEEQLRDYSEIFPMIQLFGEVPHEQAVQQQRNSAILLLLEWIDPQARGVYTGKIFEYLGARRPILAIGPKGGVIGKLLQETGAGTLVSTAEEVKKYLRQSLVIFRSEGHLTFIGDDEAIQKYSWNEQARKLTSVFEGLNEER